VARESVAPPDPIRWGVVGTGKIAATFVRDLQLLDDARCTAVFSRSSDSAADFARRFAIPEADGSYDDLTAETDVDVVYVATPHPGHAAAALRAIDAGKAVLVEKPFTLDAGQAEAVVAAARRRGVFAMEAMWTRFLPHMVRIRQLLEADVLGPIRTVTADHGQAFLPPDPTSRLYDPALGGGALLDLGIYPVSFASWVLGTPDRVTAVSDAAVTGVDAQTSMLLQYAGGAHAVLTTALGAVTVTRAQIAGETGRIDIDPPFYQPSSFTLTLRSSVERFEQPRIGQGLRHQAAEVGRCLRAGLTESPVMPLDETLAIMRTMDEVRRQIGLVYPEQ
jgi:predicted dehydrogenase